MPQALFLRAGRRQEDVTLLLSEIQISDERFLLPVSDLLATGQVGELVTVMAGGGARQSDLRVTSE